MATNNEKMDPGMDSVPSREKLMEKYKQALTIAQKAKNARDDAMKENKLILTENETLRGKVKVLEKQYGTAEEMLAALTDQKLKLAMEIDDLKKQKALFLHELKSKENAEIEVESFKRQYNRLLNENEDLIKRFGSTESETVQLRKEFNELKIENENLKRMYINIHSEKEDLDKSFKETLERLCCMEQNQNILNASLSKKFNKVVPNIGDWGEIIASLDERPSEDLLSEIESLKAEKEKCNNSIGMITKEKENFEQEVLDLNERIKNIREELDVANSDRDKMMSNLEKVGQETKQLIENSEKLTDEIGILKEEKYRQDQAIMNLQNENDNFCGIIRENELELFRMNAEVHKFKEISDEMKYKIERYETDNCEDLAISYDLTKSTDFTEEKTEVTQAMKKEASVNSELNQLQEELQAFSSEIVKYKEIADLYENKYLNAKKEVDEMETKIKKKDIHIEEYKSKLASFEEQQYVLKSNLSECKGELLSALEDLSNAEDIKGKLESESEGKEQRMIEVLDDIRNKDFIITEKLKEIQQLETQLSGKNNELVKYQDQDAKKQKEITLLMEETNHLKTSITNMIEENKLKLEKYENEISKMKETISEYEKNTDQLTVENSKLTKQLKKLLNDQASENSSLVEKLSTLQESLEGQLHEKQLTISRLEEEIRALGDQVASANQLSQQLSTENGELKKDLLALHSTHTQQSEALSKQNHQLQQQIESHLSTLDNKNSMLTDLKNELIRSKDELQKEKDIISQEITELNSFISSSTVKLNVINQNILSDISLLNKDLKAGEKADTTEDLGSLPQSLASLSDQLKYNQLEMHEGINTIIKSHQALINENNKNQTQLQSLNSKILLLSQLESKLQETVQKVENQNKIIEELEKEKCDFTKEDLSKNQNLKDLENEYTNLKISFSNLAEESERNIDKKQRELEKHIGLVEKLRGTIQEMEQKEMVLIAAQEKGAVLEAEVTEKNTLLIEEITSLRNLLAMRDMSLEEKQRDLEEHIVLVERLKETIQEMERKESVLIAAQEKGIVLETEVTEKNTLLTEEIMSLRGQLAEKDSSLEEKSSYIEEIKTLKGKIEQLQIINESLSQNMEGFKENFESNRMDHSKEKIQLTDKINLIQEELKNCNELLDFKTVELKENNRIWAGRFSSLKIALIGLNKSRKEIKNHFEVLENFFVSFVGQMKEPFQEKMHMVVQDSLSSAKHELLNEMHQMNQALKERGESISKLEFSVSELQKKLKQVTALNENVNVTLDQVRSELKESEGRAKEKEGYIRQLEEENEQLKESHDNADVLSTSTISRTEEHSRLKDVEDSFEDRYTKLKMLAVKMKKRIGELTQSLETERSKMATERSELQEKISGMSTAVKNAQKLQELFDQSLDERDELNKKNKSLENALEEIRSSEESLKNKITSLESSNLSIPVMKKHIDSLNAVIKESKAELQKLQMENKAENIKYEEMKKANTKLETKLQEVRSSLEQAKQQGKNSNVLELEIKNYEKIITDLSSQINTEKNVVKSLQSENEATTNVKVGLQDQISILEKQIKVEEERNQHTNDQLASTRSKLEESSSHIERLNKELEDLQQLLTAEKHQTEALTLEMSQVTSDFSKKELSMTARIATLQEQIRSQETCLVTTKQELTTCKQEIDHLHEEYEGYKLRAQTILAKRKGEFVTHGEKEAKEDVERLKKDCKLLEEKIEAYINEIDTLNTRLSSISLEKTRSDKKYEEMKHALQQKIADFDLLNTEFHNFKITNESTIENLKEEMVRKKNEYQSEISHQRKIIDDLYSEFKLKEETLQERKDKSDLVGYVSGFAENLPLPLEREDGEGSESVPSPQTRRRSSIIPLDVLLNNPILDENKVTILQEQTDKLRRELTSYEVRCRHLSSLLSEAEKDSARNLHQNKMLKEELRRLERSLERQPHVANTEYLKNVVFKFVTLPHGDERGRLVPVLDTLLKLSPEETHKLNNVAKGYEDLLKLRVRVTGGVHHAIDVESEARNIRLCTRSDGTECIRIQLSPPKIWP